MDHMHLSLVLTKRKVTGCIDPARQLILSGTFPSFMELQPGEMASAVGSTWCNKCGYQNIYCQNNLKWHEWHEMA